MTRLDLHLHTFYSDGDRSPAEVVELAHRAQVMAMAITDHDSTAGVVEAVTVGQQVGIKVIPGVEVSARYQGKETHILGYGIDPMYFPFQERLRWLRESRVRRVRDIVERLRHLGLSIQYEDIQTVAGAGAIGRPHIAQVLLDRGYVHTIHEAFEAYL
ncbi:MAG: PHP domain-containing protein, partial [Nitrospirae bacterium]